MSSASRIIRHSRKFCNGRSVLSSEASVLGRYFSTNGSPFAGKGNDILKGRQCGLSGKENRCIGKDFALFKASSEGISKSFARTNMNGSIPMARMGLSHGFSSLQTTLRRGFSSSSVELMASTLRHLAGNHSSVRITNPLFFAIQGLRYRKLEVILTTNIEKLGKAGETVKVAPGHFRNHLMPKLLAVPNIDKYAFFIREQRKLYQREEVETVAEVPKTEDTDATAMKMEDKMKEYQAAANQLDKARLGLRRLIKVDNELRSPVTKEELVAEVARQLCVSIHPDNLHLPLPLTSLGEYEIPLRLPRSIPRPEGKLQWTLNVKIRRK